MHAEVAGDHKHLKFYVRLFHFLFYFAFLNYFTGVLLEYPTTKGFQWGHLKNDPYIHLHSKWRKWQGILKLSNFTFY